MLIIDNKMFIIEPIKKCRRHSSHNIFIIMVLLIFKIIIGLQQWSAIQKHTHHFLISIIIIASFIGHTLIIRTMIFHEVNNLIFFIYYRIFLLIARMQVRRNKKKLYCDRFFYHKYLCVVKQKSVD